MNHTVHSFLLLAGCCNTSPEILYAQRKTLPSCPGSETSIICVVLQTAVPGGPGLVLPNAVQRIEVCSCPKKLFFSDEGNIRGCILWRGETENSREK